MKAGLTTSVVLHVAILGFGLVSLSAPRPFEPVQESLPVNIIPIEEYAQALQGDEKAPMAEKSAPLPTSRPDIVADAQKVGENSVDTDAPVTPEAKPRPVETAALPAPQPKPVVKPSDEETPKPKEEPTPVPATEAAPVRAPKQDVKPDPVREEPKPEPVKQPEPKPEPVKQPEPKPAPEPKPEPVKQAEPKPEPEPEQTAAIEPSVTKPDAVAEAIEQAPKETSKEAPKEESVALPSSAPAPRSRPRPAEAQTAKSPEHKAADKPVKEASSKPKSDSEEFSEDKVAALLNKEKASGGGAKRSTETAALGGKKKTGEKLTNSEMGALSDQLGGCWSIPAGMEAGEGLRVSVKFRLDSSGKLDGRPQVESSSGNQPFDESAVRAVQKCDRDGLILPPGKEEIWAEVVVNFDPTDMGM